MEEFLKQLDEYFCAHYSDYTKISAIGGYEMPEMLRVERDGNLSRRDSSHMRLCHQKNCAALLQTFKNGLVDTDFTFSFAFRSVKQKFSDLFSKATFAKLLPAALHRCGETAESAGEKLAIDSLYWGKIVKGKLYPEKNTVLALALVTRMQQGDVQNLLNACGFSFDEENVRDVVVRYLIEQKIFNADMRDRCLAEYAIENLPIKREQGARNP